LKKLNLPLIIGVFILSIILFVMLFPKVITKTNPYLMESTKKIATGGTISLQGAPFPPSSENPLGTDKMGRDIFSFMVHGTRLTISIALFVVLGRFLVALPFGLSAGFGSYSSKAIINQFSTIFSAIPSLVISAMILKMDFFTNLYKSQSILAFVMVLTFVGWSRIGLIIAERVEEIMSRPFIRGEIAIGKSRLQIALQNVIPHLAAELVVLLFMEMALALTIIMQLAIFEVFIGNLRIVTDTDGGSMLYAAMSFEPEWASLIATGRSYLKVAPWHVLFPALAFFISILGFNFVGEGLRIKLQQKNSDFIVHIRRFLTLDRNLLSSIKFKAGVGIVTVLVIFIMGTRMVLVGRGAFDVSNSSGVYKGAFKNQVVIGSDEAKETAGSLVESLKELGYKTLVKDSSYIQEFDIGEAYAAVSSKLEVISSEGSNMLKHGSDYSFGGFGDFELSGPLYDGRGINLYSFKDYSQFENKFLLLDSSYYSKQAIKYFSEELTKLPKLYGVIWIMPKGEVLPDSAGLQKLRAPVIYIESEASKQLMKRGANLNLSLKSGSYSQKGRNVLGILEGVDPKLSKEAIIIGVGYNYMSEESEKGKAKINLALELARKISLLKEDRNRTIIFAFWDGTVNEDLNGIRYYADYALYPQESTVLHVDLSNIDALKGDKIYMNTEQAPFAKYFSWIFGYKLETALRESGYKLVKYRNPRNVEEIIIKGARADEALYYKAGIPTVIIGLRDGESEGNKEITLEKLGRILFENITKNTY
jgi:peptide/nickel transport system permease protein